MADALKPCSRCGGSGTEPRQPAMDEIRDYMRATGWEPDPCPGTAGALWHHDGYPHAIGVFHEAEPGSLEWRGVIDRLALAEGRGYPEVIASVNEMAAAQGGIA